ncbi:2-oxoglutarate dehydrogenase complex dihydrolipoyllysine-residue succinyltransferase [Opitutales bacterium]|nr:2-oxoglutarate dehydrogenase complex dihydrolipoyllysine-residue succinyltransferase [Opitutales bacterium]
MPKEVIIPALGESIASGILSSWKVQEGSYVELDQPIYELETDKITQEGLAETNGIIKFTAQEGDEVEIGATIATIDEAAEAPIVAESPSAEPSPPSESPPAAEEIISKPSPPAVQLKSSIPEPVTSESATPFSPAVRKLLDETGIDPTTITGTGKDGRITKGDVLKIQSSTLNTPKTAQSDVAAKSAPSPKINVPVSTGDRFTRRPLTPIRRKIASRLVEAQQTAAILSTFNEVDLSAVMALRKSHQDAFVKAHGVKLGFMSFFVKAVVHALQAVPGMNVRIEGDQLIEHHYYDIGVAVGTERGLVVPVLRDCDQMSFAQIEQGIVGYAQKAKSGGITLDDMQGGCFTITNGGIYGSLLSTPIINPPQSGILGMHTIQQRPVVLDGEIVARPMMYLALSYDHRVVDGKEAVTFLVKIKEAIEEPARLALGV